MMDQSVTRRDQPCWYRVEGVSYIAINDSFLLESCIYYLLKKHFRGLPCYTDLYEVFHEVRSSRACAPFCDLRVCADDSPDGSWAAR